MKVGTGVKTEQAPIIITTTVCHVHQKYLRPLLTTSLKYSNDGMFFFFSLRENRQRHSTFEQPTAFEIRQKNAAFNNAARAGKNPTKPSRAEQMSKQPPVGMFD